MEKKLASGNNLPVFKCSHCLARGMPLVFGNSLSIGRFKENFKNLQTTTQIKAKFNMFDFCSKNKNQKIQHIILFENS